MVNSKKRKEKKGAFTFGEAADESNIDALARVGERLVYGWGVAQIEAQGARYVRNGVLYHIDTYRMMAQLSVSKDDTGAMVFAV